MSKGYSEVSKIKNYIDRFEYLKLSGSVGLDNYEVTRWLNQRFYHTPEWKRVRDKIIVRDDGCDLAHPDYRIGGKILIHHIEPITMMDILDRSYKLFDPDNLICVSPITHNAIHYGDQTLLMKDPVVRFAGDTKLW